tara:strand:- start:267 stop:431 length:165 start_codon:yes stop_codon:yes gene_type:complete
LAPEFGIGLLFARLAAFEALEKAASSIFLSVFEDLLDLEEALVELSEYSLEDNF